VRRDALVHGVEALTGDQRGGDAQDATGDLGDRLVDGGEPAAVQAIGLSS
jgi:hypothetical protein